jgi:hypothetical protein
MGLGHGSLGRELWLGLFSVAGSLELRQTSVRLLALSYYVSIVTHMILIAARSITKKSRETRGGKTFWLKYQYVLVSPIF